MDHEEEFTTLTILTGFDLTTLEVDTQEIRIPSLWIESQDKGDE